jgi:signal transduction histidine kinase
VALDIRTGDELEEVGAAFNTMAVSLRKLETMRQDMINMIVHDLKSPLSTILASLDYILSEELGKLPEDQKNFMAISQRSGNELLNMIQTLLDIAKMEEGKMTLSRETFAPVPWAEKAVRSFQPIAEMGKKQLSLTAASPLPEVEGDVVLLGRVLGNLLSNALRHTRMNVGVVSVHLEADENILRVSVKDNGEGIPLEQQASIFEKFVQADGAHQRARSGTGLGLTFCKMAVEAHGGMITVQSAPQQGSTFTFTVPLVRPASSVESTSTSSKKDPVPA